MDTSLIIAQAMPTLKLLLIPGFLIFVIKSPWFKGAMGELLVRWLARMRLPRDTYLPLHNVTLPTVDGSTQIDHVFVSRYGVFVVETKNMKGWIFGSERQAQWTQKIYRKSFRFQNPLRQNYKHLKALESALSIPADRLHSVVVFVGDCDLKTAMPANVTYGRRYIDYIKSFKEPVFSDSEVGAMVETIQLQRFTPSLATHRQHVAGLQKRGI